MRSAALRPSVVLAACLAAFVVALAGAGTLAGQGMEPEDASSAGEDTTGLLEPLLVLIAAPPEGDGATLPALGPEALSLTVGGVPRELVRQGVARGPERVVIYLDLVVLESAGLRAAAAELAERARELTRLGPVEVVGADEEGVRTLAPPTEDPSALADSLAWIGLRHEGRGAIARHRADWLDTLDAAGAAGGASGRPAGSVAGAEARRLRDLGAVRAGTDALAAEARLIRDRREMLILWSAEQEGVRQPSVLVPVVGGTDAEPERFYRQTVRALGIDAPDDALARPVILPTVAEVGRVLAAHAWTVVAYQPGASGATLLDTGAADPAPWLRDQAGSGGSRQPGDDGAPALMDLGDLLEPEAGEAAAGETAGEVPGGAALFLDPAGAWSEVAGATGGAVVLDTAALAGPDGLLARLAAAPRLAFAAPAGDGFQPIELRLAPGVAADGVTVTARRWTAAASPESIAAVRARRLLVAGRPGGGRRLADEGTLPVDAALVARLDGAGVAGGEARLAVRIEPETTAATAADPFRLTVGLDRGSLGEPLVFSERLVPELQEDGSLLLRLPVTLPAGGDARVAVVVEALGPDPVRAWGGTLATLLDAAEETETASLDGTGPVAVDGAPVGGWQEWEDDLLPSSEPLRLIRPDEPFVLGRTRLRAVPTERIAGRLARLVFSVDGSPVGERRGEPWAVSVDLGDLPRTRRVEAVAYAADGSELGRDVMTLNQGSSSLAVRIVEPSPEATGSGGAPLTGPVDVDVELTVPGGTTVDRLELYWNTERVATRFAAPWRQRLVIPAGAPQGFIRAVAHTADGAVAEDVVFLNGPGSGERLEVSLVELYVVVTDRDGRPVEGLGAEDFRLVEEGVEQGIATFSESADLPLTVGLAIDSSASMFVKLPSVARAAGEFVEESLDEQDRGFVVGFGETPVLAQGTTADAHRLLAAAGSLQPTGQTALWEGIVYSLVQLQGTPGKKALIVYTDGADEDEDFSYRTTLRFARRLGVPIYVILTNNEIVRTGGKGFGVRRFLAKVRRLTDSVGGRIYTVRHGADLDAVYREIGEELRSQYLLAYYPSEAGEGGFRQVRVEVLVPGLEARTVAGYYR